MPVFNPINPTGVEPGSYSFAGRYGPEIFEDENRNLLKTRLVTVRIPGELTLATLYSDRTKSAAAPNPFTTDARGNGYFFADPGEYDLDFSGWILPVTVMMDPEEAQQGGPPSGPAGGVLAGNYPNPTFADDLASGADLVAHAADTTNVHGIVNTALLATQAYADAAAAAVVDAAPALLNTINEVAAALGDDPNFATTIMNLIALRALKAGDIFTGEITVPDLKVSSGLAGFSTTRFFGRKTTSGPPTTGTWVTGDEIRDLDGLLWYCTAGGTSGTWITNDITICSSGTRPTTGLFEGRQIWETDTDSLLVYTGTQWRKPWNLPWGTIAYQEVVAAQNGIQGGADLTGLTISYTSIANRRVRTSAIAAFTTSVDNDLGRLDITDGANVIQQASQKRLTNQGNVFVTASIVETLAAGAVTRKLRYVRSAGTGVHNLNATAAQPAYILVEDVGPNGAAA